MPAAVPGVGECRICFETVPFVKVLDCGHTLCAACASKMLERKMTVQNAQHEKLIICCPECRRSTDCGRQGIRDLKTRYFGKLKCDLCLDKKDVDDCWWCAECVRTICSKCSIKEHSKKGHVISEWNKFDPVKYSVNYVNQVRIARQGSAESEHNRHVIKTFLESVECALRNELHTEPELDRLQTDLYERYGSYFFQKDLPRPASTPSLSAGAGGKKDGPRNDEDGPRVVAKVLQLAGANTLETLIPSVSDQKFQIYFSVTPDEVAKYLRTKIDFIPYEKSEAQQCQLRPAAPLTDPADSAVSYRRSHQNVAASINEEAQQQQRQSHPQIQQQQSESNQPTNECYTLEEIPLFSPSDARSPITHVDYDECNSLMALRYASAQLSVVNLRTCRVTSNVAVQQKFECRSFAFCDGLLYLALQSTMKRHEWSLQAMDFSKTPAAVVFITPFDIDPEDRVERLLLRAAPAWHPVDGKNAKKNDCVVLYEIRHCTKNVSEIWKAQFDKRKPSSKIKLKETLVYQKDEAMFTHLHASAMHTNAKEQMFFVYDDFNKSLNRLIVRDNRCQFNTRIMTAPSAIPFCLDPVTDRLWLFDPCTERLCESYTPVSNKMPVAFREYCRFSKYDLLRVWPCGRNRVTRDEQDGSENDFVVVGVHLAPDSKFLRIVKFRKRKEDDESSSRNAAAGYIKRRSISAFV